MLLLFPGGIREITSSGTGSRRPWRPCGRVPPCESCGRTFARWPYGGARAPTGGLSAPESPTKPLLRHYDVVPVSLLRPEKWTRPAQRAPAILTVCSPPFFHFPRKIFIYACR
ncbi:hypothetical protein B0H17DRAFT_202144 [Mycena rosella]|uniref:Uncharacterized protein n=1 Tax=Mycena rosella TaxID=1033263 RepID=A0AAD7CYP5_MYCRO|nr:hypothetical protein B0H17DRAFT_202144 [Mycena rosella]